jgi:hypothetical protein
MNRRFSDRQLYTVRNNIPIRHVIENMLSIPSETVRGVFRFRCPVCEGRHTAIKPDTNLSRCFHCQRNFNAVDLCMLVKRMDFVESVTFLIENARRLSPLESKLPSGNDAPRLESKKEPSRRPVAVNDIIAKLIGKELGNGLTEHLKPVPFTYPSPNDIVELERIVNALSQMLQRLKTNPRHE